MHVTVSAIMDDGLDRKGERYVLPERWLEAVEHCGRSGNGGSDGNSARKEGGGRARKATEIAGAAEGTVLEWRGSLRIKEGARRERGGRGCDGYGF